MEDAREVVSEGLVGLLLYFDPLADLIDLLLEVAVGILRAPAHFVRADIWLVRLRLQVDLCAILGYLKVTRCLLDILPVLVKQVIHLFEVARVIVYVSILFSLDLQGGLAGQSPSVRRPQIYLLYLLLNRIQFLVVLGHIGLVRHWAHLGIAPFIRRSSPVSMSICRADFLLDLVPDI